MNHEKSSRSVGPQAQPEAASGSCRGAQLLLAALFVTLTGCGQKGALTLPQDAVKPATGAAAASGSAASAPVLAPR
ncbi:LPS translocon maturation chaperone LptM [Roseateles sp. PN1]|uniref:LPS translocon maturation chaperone LptM n=1 Tax=Roseateles sp. PN1 TaxID=3137372 RepID=UPI004053BAB8